MESFEVKAIVALPKGEKIVQELCLKNLRRFSWDLIVREDIEKFGLLPRHETISVGNAQLRYIVAYEDLQTQKMLTTSYEIVNYIKGEIYGKPKERIEDSQKKIVKERIG